MPRRIYTYPADAGWTELNVISTIGAVMMGIGFIFLCINVVYTYFKGERDLTGDPWDGRTLEWSIPSPAPHYNFAVTPQVKGLDAWWMMKKERKEGKEEEEPEYKPIHMPSNSGRPFIMSIFFFIAGFGLVFEWMPVAIIGLIGVIICMILRSFEYDDGYYVPVEEIKQTEAGRE